MTPGGIITESHMNLVDFLLQGGYRQVPLSRSGVGHLHAAGTLNGRPVSVLLDTGGASTVISLTLAQELGLTLTKMPSREAGRGRLAWTFTTPRTRSCCWETLPRAHAR